MQLLKYFAIILLGFVANHQCIPVSQSFDTTQSGSSNNPERNAGLDGGDMVPAPYSNFVAGKGVAIRPAYHRWAGGVIPYEMASNITTNNTNFIIQQMRAIENLTSVNNVQCIRFREKNASDPYFITIFNGSGCYAPVGSWGNYVGVRPVSLFHGTYSTCMISGIIQHELTHVLGFYHEQSRPDRDTYVSIQWPNILPANAFNFDIYNDTDVDTQMTSYDYGSVMHYERNAFAINSSGPTIIPIQNASAFIGQRVQISPIDILEIQRYYNCVSPPSNLTTTINTTATTTTVTTGSTATTATTSRTTSSTSISTTTTTVTPGSTATTTTTSRTTSSTSIPTTTTTVTTGSTATTTTTSITTSSTSISTTTSRTTSSTSTSTTTSRTTSTTSTTETTSTATSSTTSRTTATSATTTSVATQTTTSVVTQTTTSVTTATTTSATTKTTTSATTKTTTSYATRTTTSTAIRHAFQSQLGIFIIWLIPIIHF